MRIGLTKPDNEGERHVLIEMTPKEERTYFYPLYRDVLEYKMQRSDRRAYKKEGVVRFRISLDHLEEIVNTFPFADLSPIAYKQVDHLFPTHTNGKVPDLVIPGLKKRLRDYQKIAVAKIIDDSRFMENDVLGLGKTAVALASLAYLDAYPTLVVCPASARWVWERENTKFTPSASVAVVAGTARERKEVIQSGADITVINYEALRLHPELVDIKFEACIADEFHRIKNPTAQMTKAFHRLRAKRWIPMSGTPIINRVEESWSGLHRLYPERFPSMFLFEARYCIKGGFEKKQIVGYRNLAELRSFIHKHSIRRRQEDVLKDLPQRVNSVRLIENTTEQAKLYRQIEKEAKLKLENGEIKNIPGILAVITRLKQACFSPELYGGSKVSAKLEELQSIVEELVANGEKAIIFSQWSKATRIIERELQKYNPAYVDGSVKDTPKRQKRMEQIDRFNTDTTVMLYIGTIKANREAITLSAATTVIFTDKEWSPLYNEQAVGRSAAGGLRGLGKKGMKVHVIDLLAVGTIEERIEKMLEEKQAMFNALYERGKIPKQEKRVMQTLKDLFV